MSDQDDIFMGDDHTPAPPTIPAFTDLVGEDKKYKTQDDVAKAIHEKDSFIEQLKRENAEARKALGERMNEEDFLKKLREAVKSPEPQDPPAERRDVQPDNAQSAITPDKLETYLEAREAEKQRKQNLAAVEAKLQEVFGENYRSRVQSQARELKVSTSYLTAVAAESPEAFFRLMPVEPKAKEPFTPAPRSAVSTPVHQGTGKKDYAYYAKLRQEKGDHWYFSIPVQQEIWKAAKEAEARGEQFLPE